MQPIVPCDPTLSPDEVCVRLSRITLGDGEVRPEDVFELRSAVHTLDHLCHQLPKPREQVARPPIDLLMTQIDQLGPAAPEATPKDIRPLAKAVIDAIRKLVALCELEIPKDAPSWITRELVDKTLCVWQPRYTRKDGGLLSPVDALEIIQAFGSLVPNEREAS